MKIRGNSDVDEALRIQQAQAQATSTTAKQKTTEEQATEGAAPRSDTVTLSTTARELDPDQMVAERRAKVEKFKKLYEEGNLKAPAGAEIAMSVAQGIDEEVADLRSVEGE